VVHRLLPALELVSGLAAEADSIGGDSYPEDQYGRIWGYNLREVSIRPQVDGLSYGEMFVGRFDDRAGSEDGVACWYKRLSALLSSSS